MPSLRKLATVLTLSSFLTYFALAQSSNDAAPKPLLQQIETMIRTNHSKVALFAKNLKTGQTVAIEPDRPVPTASVIKLPILIEVMYQVKAGKRLLNDKITMQKNDIVLGSGVLQFTDTPLTLTLKDLLYQMIIESDNTAANLIIDQLGVGAVNARIAQMGLKDTYLYSKIGKPATEPMPADQNQFGLGKTTAREMAKVVESIQNCDLDSEKLCNLMTDMMRHQQNRNMIPHYIETVDTSVEPSFIGDKIGTLDTVRNDVGFIYAATGPIVISAFTYENQDDRWNSDNSGEMLIARMSKAIMDDWSPQGLAKKAWKGSAK